MKPCKCPAKEKNWEAVSILWKQCLCTVLFQTIHLANISFHWLIFTMWYMVSVWCMWSKLFSSAGLNWVNNLQCPYVKVPRYYGDDLREFITGRALAPFSSSEKYFSHLNQLKKVLIQWPKSSQKHTLKKKFSHTKQSCQQFTQIIQ